MENSVATLDLEGVIRLLESAADARVLVVGDAMLDRYVAGDVERISPEAPVPVVRVRDEWLAPGGAANVACGVAALGASCRLVSVCGEDGEGEELGRLLEEAGVDAGGLVVEPGRPTPLKSRVLARHQQMLRIDREVTHPLPGSAREGVLERVREALPWANVVAVADYDKGVLDEGLGRQVVEAAESRDVPVVVDPKLRNFFGYGGGYLFKPNGPELAAARGAETPPREAEELETVRRRVGCRHLLVTLGEEGMLLVSEDEPGATRIPSEAREVYDVSGAGDTVTAVLAATVPAASVPEAATLANFAAGIEVSRLGAVPVGRDDILEALRAGPGSGDAGGGSASPTGSPAPRGRNDESRRRRR